MNYSTLGEIKKIMNNIKIGSIELIAMSFFIGLLILGIIFSVQDAKKELNSI